jgi:hypothetical protein
MSAISVYSQQSLLPSTSRWMLALQDNAEIVASCGYETIRLVDSVIHLHIRQYNMITGINVQIYSAVFSYISALLSLFFLRLLVYLFI